MPIRVFKGINTTPSGYMSRCQPALKMTALTYIFHPSGQRHRCVSHIMLGLNSPAQMSNDWFWVPSSDDFTDNAFVKRSHRFWAEQFAH